MQSDGSIVFVDFGAVAILSAEMKNGIPRFIEGVLKRDNDQISAALQQMGLIALNDDAQHVEQLVDFIYSRFLKQMTVKSWNLSDVTVSMQDKLDMMVDFSKMDISLRELMATFQIPKDLVLLTRTILLLLGVCTYLSPTMNPMKTIRPYLESFVLGKDKNWIKLIETAVKDIALSAITIPAELQNYLIKANHGGVEVKGLSESANLVYALGGNTLSLLGSVVAPVAQHSAATPVPSERVSAASERSASSSATRLAVRADDSYRRSKRRCSSRCATA